MNQILLVTDAFIEIPPKIRTREVVRAIIIHENKLLLMYSRRDHMVGTPGGGIILNESKLDALYRELLEEVGAKEVRIIEHLGYVEEIRKSRSLNQPMRILSDYYHVEVKEFVNASLEEHEEEMGLEPRYMNIDDAISLNERQLALSHEDNISFYYTQTKLLKYIKEKFNL